MARYQLIPKPKAGDVVNSQQYGSLLLMERKGFGDWAAQAENGKVVRIQGLAEVDILRPLDPAPPSAKQRRREQIKASMVCGDYRDGRIMRDLAADLPGCMTAKERRLILATVSIPMSDPFI